MSHAGNLIVIIFSLDGRDVGIDVEKVRTVDGVLELARVYFGSNETAMVAAATESERVSAFLRIWTRKEAVLKADGRGLSVPLNDFDTCANETVIDDTWTFTLGGLTREWTIHNITLPNYIGAFAYSGRRTNTLILRYPTCKSSDDLSRLFLNLRNSLTMLSDRSTQDPSLEL
jgi:4'-phosphopantetheinyl transferase